MVMVMGMGMGMGMGMESCAERFDSVLLGEGGGWWWC